MAEHAVVQLRVTYSLDPEDPAWISGYGIAWRKPFEKQWELIASASFAPIHVADFPTEVDGLLKDAIMSLPQVLPFE